MVPCVATTATDCDGRYEFAGLPAAGRYHMAGVMVEGAELLLIVAITSNMRAGEGITLNLSANYPWIRDAMP